MIEAILFDLDGTLVNSLPYYLKSYDFVLKKFGINLPPKEAVRTCFGITEENICKNLGIPERSTEFRDLYFTKVKEYILSQPNIFKGVIETLNFAKKNNIRMALVSFAYRWYVDKMLKKLELTNFFDTIIGFDNVKKVKPDPEGVLLVCSKLKVSPSDTLVVGDSGSDIKMGNSAGSETVLFHPKNYALFYDLKKLKLAKPKYIVKNYDELKRIIEGI